jgi:hypothetical protein
MRSISFQEFRDTTNLTNDRLKVLRQRGHAVRAFGGSEIFESLGYIELDAVAVRLADVLAEKLDRTLAAEIVRDLWGVWSRVVAAAEASPAGSPILWYVIGYDNAKGQRWYLTLGSKLDSRKEKNLREIAEDVKKRTGITAKDFVVVEMQSVLADVRAAAKAAKHDFSAAFLPPYDSDELEALLQPFDDSMPDRAIVVDKAKQEAADVARRTGILARATVEAGLPAREKR